MTYGTLGNAFFKFFDIRLAESTTRTGQVVLNHMIRLIASKLDGEYTFPSNCIIGGDTDSTLFLTYTSSPEEALLVAKGIQKIVNKSFETTVVEKFFASVEKKNYINVEQEVVADYGIYVAKKNYILHLVYEDGKPVDKIKIKGLQIKKTNIPKPIAKNLVKFVENLLRGKQVKNFSRDLVNYRDEIKNSELLSIGIPSSVNKVQQYTEEFLLNVKTRLPGHVAASILWNACLKQFDDHESQKIVSGSKIKKFKLKKKYLYNGRQFTSIAVPSDSKKLPLWFMENFDKLVDREEQMITLIDKPFEKITTAIGELLPTKNLLHIEDEFEY